MKRAPLLLAALLAGLPQAARAGSGGATPYSYLNLDPNARAAALGGAYTSLASDSGAIFYNPAGLAMLQSHEASFMHESYVQGLTHEYGAIALKPGVGADFNYRGSGAIGVTRYDLPDGTGLGSYDVTDMSFGLAYGHVVAKDLSLGFGYRYMSSSIGGIKAVGHGSLGGALWRPLPGLSLGAAVQNLGSRASFEHSDEDLPVRIRWGASYAFQRDKIKAVLTVDGVKDHSQDAVSVAGIETWYLDTLALRLGYSGINDAGPGVTAGVGVRYGHFRLDYAIVPYGDLGYSHRLGLTLRWDTPEALSRPAAAAPRAAAPAPAPAPAPAAPLAVAQPEPSPELTPSEGLSRAEALLRQKKLALAAAELDAVEGMLTDKDPLIVRYHRNRGWWHGESRPCAKNKDCAKAKAEYAAGIQAAAALRMRGAEVGRLYLGMASSLETEGDLAEAVRYLEKGLEAQTSGKVREILLETLERLKKPAP